MLGQTIRLHHDPALGWWWQADIGGADSGGADLAGDDIIGNDVVGADSVFGLVLVGIM